MIKVENVEIFNLHGAIRGMRNPLESWDKSDSDYCMPFDDSCDTCDYDDNKNSLCNHYYNVGENDLKLMRTLYNGGPDHSKFLRQIFVCMDITTDSFVWAEIDTYKVFPTRNSCSFQHKGTSRPFKLEFFSYEPVDEENTSVWFCVIRELNRLRDLYLKTNDYRYFRQIRKLLPSGWLIKATYTMNYANVMNMINQRQSHRLEEWHTFCDKLRELPYVKEIRGEI